MLDSPRQEKTFRPTKEQPAYLTGGKLMDFQMDGVNFLRRYVMRYFKGGYDQSVEFISFHTVVGGSARVVFLQTKW